MSVVRPIDAAREKVTTLELAERLSGPGVRKGREIAFLCPLHDDREPSFLVDPQKNRWYCFPCGEGGNVVDLARRAWGYADDGRSVAEAAAMLLMEFGYDPPQRPPAWFKKQERQRPVRDGIDRARMRLARERLYRKYFAPLVEGVEDPEERARDEQSLWEATEPLARLLVESMRRAADDS